jgi:hypothetical protein
MKFKYFTKELLRKVNNRAIANNYNRAVEPEFIEQLPDDLHFPVTLTLLHEHAAGKPVAPHMRCRIMTGQSITGPFNYVFVDVEMGMYEMLPDAEVPMTRSKKKKSKTEFSAN